MLLRAQRNDPRRMLKAALDSEISSPLFLCQVQPHKNQQEKMKHARSCFPQKELNSSSINKTGPLLDSHYIYIEADALVR